jgi:hypothetical protein
MPPRIPPDQVSPAMNDLPNFDPIAVADEIAALETEAQDKLAEANDEFKDRSEKIATILWNVKQHHRQRSQDDQTIPAGDRGAPSQIQGEEKGERCRATQIRGRYQDPGNGLEGRQADVGPASMVNVDTSGARGLRQDGRTERDRRCVECN